MAGHSQIDWIIGYEYQKLEIGIGIICPGIAFVDIKE